MLWIKCRVNLTFYVNLKSSCSPLCLCHKLQIHRIIVSFVIWPCIRHICILTDTLSMIASYQYRLNNWQNIISNVIRSLPPYPASDILHGTRHSLYIMTLFHSMMRPTDWHATDYKLSHPCIDCTVLSCGHDRVCWLLALFSVTCGVLAGPGQWWSVYLVLTPGTRRLPGSAQFLWTVQVSTYRHITARVSWLSTLHHVTDRW